MFRNKWSKTVLSAAVLTLATVAATGPGVASAAGAVQTRATGLAGMDDFAFTGRGDQILAALNGPGEVALVQPDGTHTTVLTAADGLQNPTSIALRGDTAYVLSAAYVTAEDPNLLLAHLNE
ncbi:hypothetical protein ACFWTC_12570 [Streptomyces sp. NPDC058619]|uniref:hypothetical protein n=1 Tax=unclassified Streptomyces TaxID=2593676 RepID=UPI00364975C7